MYLHTVDTKTVTPTLRQTVTAISTTNARCTIFKRESFNIKVHIVYKILALVLAIISLLEKNKTLLLSLHREVGATVFMSTVCNSNILCDSCDEGSRNETEAAFQHRYGLAAVIQYNNMLFVTFDASFQIFMNHPVDGA